MKFLQFLDEISTHTIASQDDWDIAMCAWNRLYNKNQDDWNIAMSAWHRLYNKKSAINYNSLYIDQNGKEYRKEKFISLPTSKCKSQTIIDWYETACSIEEKYTKLFVKISKESGCELAGMFDRLKEGESLLRKLNNSNLNREDVTFGELSKNVTDCVRYSIEHNEYNIEKTVDLLEKGLKKLNCKYRFPNNCTKVDNLHNVIECNIIDSTGISVECWVVMESVLANQNQWIHSFYEMIRDPETYKLSIKEMNAISNIISQIYIETIPKGFENIKDVSLQEKFEAVLNSNLYWENENAIRAERLKWGKHCPYVKWKKDNAPSWMIIED